jgi:hypothetical protein
VPEEDFEEAAQVGSGSRLESLGGRNGVTEARADLEDLQGPDEGFGWRNPKFDRYEPVYSP